MAISPLLPSFAGTWVGENTLHDPVSGTIKTVATTFHNRLILKETVLELDYTWEYDGTPQQGHLTLGYNDAKSSYFGSWLDTWHMSGEFLLLEGKGNDHGIDLAGTYTVEGYGTWGWTTSLRLDEPTLTITMKNVSPEKVEYPAVDIVIRRS